MGLMDRLLGLFGRTGSSTPRMTGTLSDPSAAQLDLWGGTTTRSSMRVNAQNALTLSTIWRACNLIGRDVAKLPFEVFERNPTDPKQRERSRTHPAWRILRRRANEEMSAGTFRFAMQVRALLNGNAYAVITRDRRGAPNGLWPLPQSTVPRRREDTGVLFYEVHPTTEHRQINLRDDTIFLPPRDVFHLKALGDGILGVGIVEKAKEAIGLALAAEAYGAQFFGSGAKPSAVLEHPGQLSDEAAARLQQQLREGWSGVDNQHQTAILEEGMKLNPFGISNEDAEFLGTREFQIRDIANFTSIPPHKLGDTTRTSFSSLEQENQSYLDDALDPWLVTWEEEAWLKLFSPEAQAAESHWAEFNRDALVRTNLQDRVAFYQFAVTNGVMNRNEVRALENMPPTDDGLGDEYLQPMNMQVWGEEPEEPPPAPGGEPEDDAPEEDPDAAQASLRELERFLTYSVHEVERSMGEIPAESFFDWLELEMEGLSREKVAERGESVCTLAGVDLGGALSVFYHEVRERLLAASDCRPEKLKERLRLALEALPVAPIAREIYARRESGETELPRKLPDQAA